MVEIDRCYCFGVLFSTLRDVSAETGARSVQELQKKIVFGKQCGLCHVYVNRMMETGDVVFHEVIPQKSRPIR